MRAPHFRASHPNFNEGFFIHVYSCLKGGERVGARQTWCRVGAVGVEAVFPSPVQPLPLLRGGALGMSQDLCLCPNMCDGEDSQEESPCGAWGVVSAPSV